ncbi:MAG TPA: ATP-grasp domain-containing protein [Acidimicrobiia bacterium]|jgi:biotin carboxylase|nr:ATP-grasp domain-containing protein [Acidimicrobiia bacterium]
MPRVLLIIPTTSYRATDFFAAAESLGVEVAVAAEESLPLIEPERFLAIDCNYPEEAARAIVDLATETPIDAIVPVDDAGVVIAALAAQKLGLPHNSPESASATRDKALMRRLLAAAEIDQPAFATVDGDPTAAAASIGFPLVVKPRSLSASRGVIKVDAPSDLAPTIARVREIANDPTVLIEEFVDGPEVAVEGMLWAGELEVLAIFDKPDPLNGPFFEETIFVTPSRLEAPVQQEVARVTQSAVSALGLTEGPIHAELRIAGGNRPRLIEVAARSIGGICGRSLHFGLLDTPLEVLILRHALGRRASLPTKAGASGVMMIPTTANGILKGVKGIDAARRVEGVRSIEITTPVGARLRRVPESDRYLGFIFAAGPDAGSVEASLRQAHAQLVIDIS